MKSFIILAMLGTSLTAFGQTRKVLQSFEVLKISECKPIHASLIEYGPTDVATLVYTTTYYYEAPMILKFSQWEEDSSGRAIESTVRTKKELAKGYDFYVNYSGDLSFQHRGLPQASNELFTYRRCPSSRLSYDRLCKKLIPKELEVSEKKRLEDVAKKVTAEKAKKLCQDERKKEFEALAEYRKLSEALADDSGREISSDKAANVKLTSKKSSSSKQ